MVDAAFEELLYRSYEMLYETDDSDDISIAIKWKPIEYVPEAEKLELIGKKIEMGIVVDVAFADA